MAGEFLHFGSEEWCSSGRLCDLAAVSFLGISLLLQGTMGVEGEMGDDHGGKLRVLLPLASLATAVVVGVLVPGDGGPGGSNALLAGSLNLELLAFSCLLSPATKEVEGDRWTGKMQRSGGQQILFGSGAYFQWFALWSYAAHW